MIIRAVLVLPALQCEELTVECQVKPLVSDVVEYTDDAFWWDSAVRDRSVGCCDQEIASKIKCTLMVDDDDCVFAVRETVVIGRNRILPRVLTM